MKRLLLVLAACGGSSPPPAPPAPPAPAAAEPAHGDHHAMTHHTGHHGFDNADQWAKRFDDPSRDQWQQPDRVVGYLELKPGMTVVDIGAGTGYFEARLAKAVGASGKVLALDTSQDMVRYIGERATRESTPNVEARLIAPDDPKLAPASVDRILIVDTWHHITDRGAYAKKLAAALRPGGFVAVVDFTQETKKGPPPGHRVTPPQVTSELESAGLVTRVINELPDQFVVIARMK